MTWPVIEEKYTKLIRDVIRSCPEVKIKGESVVDPLALPVLDLAHKQEIHWQ